EELGRKAHAAARRLAITGTELKNRWLRSVAGELEKRAAEVLEANAHDLAAANEARLAAAQVDRLRLTTDRLRAMAVGLREVAGLPDPVGRLLDRNVRPNGLKVEKVSVPLGVIFFIYE